MKATLYNVVSADGYIMTKEGDESFIPDSLWPTVLDVFKRYQVFMMGKKTYDAFQDYGEDLLVPFEKLDLRKIVVSRDENFQPKSGYEVAGNPKEVIGQNENILVSSGSTLNNYLLEQKLVDTIILQRLPATLGEGLKPFDDKFLQDFVLVSGTEVDGAKEEVYKLK